MIARRQMDSTGFVSCQKAHLHRESCQLERTAEVMSGTCEKDWKRRLIFCWLMPMPVSLTEKWISTSGPVAFCTASFTAACAAGVAACTRLSGASALAAGKR